MAIGHRAAGVAVMSFGLAAVIGVAVKPADPSGAAQGPAGANVVVIQTDDQTAEMMSAMERTRRLLGDRGATFKNYFVNWPLCCPSRATLLTGQYAHNHGVLGNKPPLGGYRRFPREDNLAVWLSDADYRVGHVGKFLSGYGAKNDDPGTPYDDRFEVPPGWTEWNSASQATTYRYYGFTQAEWSVESEGERTAALVDYEPNDGYKSDVNTAAAASLIERFAVDGGAPFYLQVDYIAPHRSGGPPNPGTEACGRQAQPAPRHVGAFDDARLPALRDPSFDEADVSDKPDAIRKLPRITKFAKERITRIYRCRLESTLAVDEGVAKLVRTLRETGELDDTFVFYVSDNGYFAGEHRLHEGKNLPYEPSIHVPLLVRGPGIPAGVKVRELATNADIAPTVADVTGAAPSSRRPMDGQSLIPAATAPSETSRELLIETNRYAAVRTKRFKWIEYDDGFRELYDLRRDPFELSNKAGKRRYDDTEDHLATRLQALRSCSGEGCR